MLLTVYILSVSFNNAYRHLPRIIGRGFPSDFKSAKHLPIFITPTLYPPAPTHFVFSVLLYLFFKLIFEARITLAGWKYKFSENLKCNSGGKWETFASYCACKMTVSYINQLKRHTHTGHIYSKSKRDYTKASLFLWSTKSITHFPEKGCSLIIFTISVFLLIWTSAIRKIVLSVFCLFFVLLIFIPFWSV